MHILNFCGLFLSKCMLGGIGPPIIILEWLVQNLIFVLNSLELRSIALSFKAGLLATSYERNTSCYDTPVDCASLGLHKLVWCRATMTWHIGFCFC